MDRMEPQREQSRREGAHLPQAPAQERFDVYETITHRFIERVEKGVVPWQSPSIARVGIPRNFATCSRTRSEAGNAKLALLLHLHAKTHVAPMIRVSRVDVLEMSHIPNHDIPFRDAFRIVKA
jgi:hypothetical protein